MVSRSWEPNCFIGSDGDHTYLIPLELQTRWEELTTAWENAVDGSDADYALADDIENEFGRYREG